MPRYDFQCRQCSCTFETELSFGSDESPACPECSGDTDRLIAPPAIHFKGEGFYNSDNRKPEQKETKPEPKETKKKEKKEKKKDCSA